MFAFLCYLVVAGAPAEVSTRSNMGYSTLTGYTYEERQTSETDLGIIQVYRISVPRTPRGDCVLAFYSMHSNVNVYVDHTFIYSLYQKKGLALGKTPGNKWHMLSMYPKDAGKEVVVEIEPVYDSGGSDFRQEFLWGSKLAIWRSILLKDFPAVLLSVVAILCGIGFMAFILYNRRNPEIDRGLFMIGQFSLLIGVWKMSDLKCISLLVPNYVVQAYIPYLSLSLLVVPFALYARGLFSTRNGLIWDIPCIVSMLVSVVTLVLHIAGVCDFREILWATHLTMALMIVVVLLMLGIELRRIGWNQKIKVMVICMSTCLAGLIADIVTYYVSNGTANMIMGMVGFLIYIVVLGVMSIREAKRLMNIGMQAKHFEHIAYHDQLTGLFNRTAYADFIAQQDFKPQDCTVVMMDLNNLKFCNDTYGHEKGDLYITSSARLIQKVYGRLGRCCRMGGDEFCVVLMKQPDRNCIRLQALLKNEVAVWNKAHKEPFQMQIASGFAHYNADVDYDIGDTLRRADKMMYQEKFAMKQKKRA